MLRDRRTELTQTADKLPWSGAVSGLCRPVGHMYVGETCVGVVSGLCRVCVGYAVSTSR